MSLPEDNKLAESVRRGRLTADEEAQLHVYLSAHPGERAAWEEELNLNQLLRHVPTAPVSSNFTRRVLDAARRESQAPAQVVGWQRWWLRGWAPKLATSTVDICLGLLTYHEHQLAGRKEVAQTLATMAGAGNSLELLQNFDAIERLNQVPRDVDRDLIAALQ